MEINSDKGLQALLFGLDQINDLVMLVDCDGTILYINQKMLDTTGYSKAELIGQSPRIFSSSAQDDKFYKTLWETILSGEKFCADFINQKKNGETFFEHQTITPLRFKSDEITHYISIGQLFLNSTLPIASKDGFIFYDQLTGLPNRRYFDQEFSKALDHATRSNTKLAVFMLDLNHFKYINDTLGHHIGDEVLQMTGKRLNSIIRNSDLCARLGGDEFAIIVNDVRETSMLSMLASEIVKRLSAQLDIDGNALHVGCSIGIAGFPRDGDNSAVLLEKADRAMYEAKLHSIRHFVFYHEESGDRLLRIQQLENEAGKAIAKDHFKIFYQPQIDLKTGKCNRVEALLRWDHPVLGEVMASEFIPILENVGLAREVGYWTIQKVYEQLRDWHENQNLPINVAVNLSSHQLIQRNFIEYLKELIGTDEALNSFLNIEITESMLFGDMVTAMEKLQDMDEMGIKVSLDDFGSGYSSLQQLTYGYANLLKIDRKYVQLIPDDNQAVALVNSIIAMAHSLDMQVTAVGVENTSQLEHLKKQGCDYAQGFMFSKPLSAEEINSFFLTHAPDQAVTSSTSRG